MYFPEVINEQTSALHFMAKTNDAFQMTNILPAPISVTGRNGKSAGWYRDELVVIQATLVFLFKAQLSLYQAELL